MKCDMKVDFKGGYNLCVGQILHVLKITNIATKRKL